MSESFSALQHVPNMTSNTCTLKIKFSGDLSTKFSFRPLKANDLNTYFCIQSFYLDMHMLCKNNFENYRNKRAF